MRLVKVKTPEGQGPAVARLALDVGISQVGVYTQEVYRTDGPPLRKEVVDIETTTPASRKFVEALLAAPYYDPEEYSFSIRDARTIGSLTPVHRITAPVVEPTTEVFQELWQFVHVTPSFAVRVLVGSSLLAFGMVTSKLLFIVAGLLFLPFLPVLLALGFSLATRQWRMAVQSLFALGVELGGSVAGGALVAHLVDEPLRYTDFMPLVPGVLFSFGIGAAAAFATSDDVGWRQLIGLAAASQIALIPAWVGIALVYGFVDDGAVGPAERLIGFGLNTVTIVASALLTYGVVGMRAGTLRRLTQGQKKRPVPVVSGAQRAGRAA